MGGFKIRGSLGSEFIMDDFVVVVVFPAKKKTLEVLPYFNSNLKKKKRKRAIKSSSTSKPIMSIQSPSTILVQ